jgi:hypothetical protein
MYRHLVLLLALLAGVTFTRAASASAPEPALAEGQVWTYQTRQHEPDSRLVIVHLYQPAKGERIVYVAVLGATVRLNGYPAPFPWDHCYLPLTERALRLSLRTLASDRTERTFPELEKTYPDWKKKAGAGNVQCWTIPVTQAMDDLERRIRKAKSP